MHLVEDGNSSYYVKIPKLHFQPKHSIHILTTFIKLLSSECNIGTKQQLNTVQTGIVTIFHLFFLLKKKIQMYVCNLILNYRKIHLCYNKKHLLQPIFSWNHYTRPQINYDSYLLDFHLFSPLHPPLQLVIAVKEKQRAL